MRMYLLPWTTHWHFRPSKFLRRRSLLLFLSCILGILISIHLATSLWFYTVVAHWRVSFKSRFQTWRSFPLDLSLYQGSKDFLDGTGAVRHEQNWYGRRRCHLYDFPGPWSGQDGDLPLVSCEEIEDVRFPLCALEYPRSNIQSSSPGIGALEVIGASTGDCFQYSDRFGPYLSPLSNTDYSASVKLWEQVDLSEIQDKCVHLNQHRFTHSSALTSPTLETKSRTAIVLRAYDGFLWTDEVIANVRAMTAELTLYSGGEYQVFILLHVRNATEVPNGDAAKARYVPKALINMTETWNYTDCEVEYPNVGEYDVYFHTFMPIQLFALRHPEFDFVWNWEMDVRYTGHYGKLLTTVSQWAKGQSREQLWERNARFYIPGYHGTYRHFAGKVERQFGGSPTNTSRASRGRGQPTGVETTEEDADLITLFPIFDIAGTLWPWRDRLINYNASDSAKPRRATVSTNMRFSRQLLTVMDRENREGRTMMCEMWAPTMALRHGLKAVYVPHPVFLDRQWPAQVMNQVFNAGKNGQVGGSLDTVLNQEHNFAGTTWFWNSRFGLELFIKWMGRASDGPGSPAWQSSHGAMCLPEMLLHPVKVNEI